MDHSVTAITANVVVYSLRTQRWRRSALYPTVSFSDDLVRSLCEWYTHDNMTHTHTHDLMLGYLIECSRPPLWPWRHPWAGSNWLASPAPHLLQSGMKRFNILIFQFATSSWGRAAFWCKGNRRAGQSEGDVSLPPRLAQTLVKQFNVRIGVSCLSLSHTRLGQLLLQSLDVHVPGRTLSLWANGMC